MGTGRTTAVALEGVGGRLVDIEAALTNQTPGLKLVGLPDTALREAQARVRSAIEHSGFHMPQRHLTVNLSPAALPKHGSGFDLAIAVAILVTTGTIDAAAVGDAVHIGELGLDGRLRPVPGVLPAVRAARGEGRRRVVVPTASAAEAGLVDDLEVVAVPSLRALAIRYGAPLEPVEVEPVAGPAARPVAVDDSDLAEVVGNPHAVDAVVAAAAGGHHLLLIGPPGAGKTMLATRLSGLLPDLEGEAALDATCIASLTGDRIDAVRTRPPYQAPHHNATPAAIVGGGSGRIQPGAITLASGGVLFLDEAPEFQAAALDALRQPLESGRISVHRAAGRADFPARVQLVLAANPCPCGRWDSTAGGCSCPPTVRDRYLRRLSGPLMDRIDMRVRMQQVSLAEVELAEEGPRLTTAAARDRVLEARARARHRWRDPRWHTNSDVPGDRLRQEQWRISPDDRRGLEAAFADERLTLRGYDRVLRLAWTLADLAGIDRPGKRQIGAALAMRGPDL